VEVVESAGRLGRGAVSGELGSGALTVGEFLVAWLRHVRGRVRASTYDGYESLVRCHAIPGVGSVALVELEPLCLQDLYARLLLPAATGRAGLSAGSVRNLHLVLGQAFGQAVRWRLVAASPALGAQPPRARRPHRVVVDPPLLQKLLDAAGGDPLEAAVALAASTGMRRGEILALTWADLNREMSQLQVRRTLQPTRSGLLFEHPKTSRSRRTVALPAFIGPYLERQRARQKERRGLCAAWQEHDLVVDRGDGGPLNPDTLSSAWRRFLKRHKLPAVRFHDLRHAHATLMLIQGVHPKIVSERLGHASVGITLDTYSHVLPSMQTEAVEAFDRLFPTQVA
jgi:integrase